MLAAVVLPAQAGDQDDVPDLGEPADPAVGQAVFEPDPRLADMIAAQAEELLGDRYVDLWLAEDHQTMMVGVFEPTGGDQVLATEWDDLAEVEVAECPVSRADLDRAVEAAVEAAGSDLVRAAPDYRNGKVLMQAPADSVTDVIEQVDATDGLVAVESGQPTFRSAPGAIMVEVEASELAGPLETMDPPESNRKLPLRAGKRIWTPQSGCTANALIQIGSVKHMLTAGHCGAKNDAVTMNLDKPSTYDVQVGQIGLSTWYAVPNHGTITGDYARFIVTQEAKASIFKNSTSALNITGWATPRAGWTACTRGATTQTEKCGELKGLQPPTGPNYCRKNTNDCRDVAGLWRADVPSDDGDSGSPVYYKGPNGTVILGVLSGGNESYSRFTPFGTALAGVGAGARLVYGRGFGVPPAASVPGPLRQVLLSPDFTQDGRGEVVALDQSNRLIAWETLASGVVKPQAGIMQIGFTGYTMVAPGDWDSDGVPDMLGLLDGSMYWFKGQGGGAISGRKLISSGWGSPTQVVAVGDITSDGNPDLLVVRSGNLYLYAGNGAGGFKTSNLQVGSGWANYRLLGVGDQDGDGKADIMSIDSTGKLWFYKGKGDGTFYTKVDKGGNWSYYTVAAGADLDGDGRADVVIRNDATGKAYFKKSLGSGSFASPVEMATGW
ncbi:MAG: FG-GAP-like repeat-containing protein [Micrococcales bacterium]|nr:FG-GAP-like repeat-containing protein [Micrococcales bacterium]